MDMVLIADAGEEAPALQRQAAAERERLEERLLDLERVFGRERRHQLPAEIRIDVRADDELRFAEAEAARCRTHFSTRRREAGDLEVVRILRSARSRALQNERDVRIE